MTKRGPQSKNGVKKSLWVKDPFYGLPKSIKRGETSSGMVKYPPQNEYCIRVIFWIQFFCKNGKRGPWKMGLAILKPTPGYSGGGRIFIIPKNLPPEYSSAKFCATPVYYGKKGLTKVSRMIPIET